MTNKKILIVDDDPLIGKMYYTKLSADGYKVNIATNGEEAIIAVKKERPDLIFLDVMMPKMNGVETLKTLKTDPQTSGIPVIILTNLGDKPEDMKKAKALGALDYLVKSQISLKQLSDKAKQIIESSPDTLATLSGGAQWDSFFK